MKNALFALILLSGLTANASIDCTPQVISENETFVGPYTVTTQNNVGYIYVGDEPTPINKSPMTVEAAIAKAISLCKAL